MDRSRLRIAVAFAGLLAAAAPAGAQQFSPGASAGGPLGTQPIANSQSFNPATGSVFSIGPIPAGSNAIGSVSVTSLPALPAGSNAIGSVTVTSLPALPTGTNTIGSIASITSALPAGTNNIGGTTPIPATGTGSIAAVTAGTSSASAVAASAKRILSFKNESTSASVAVCPSSVSSPGLNTAGCYTLPAGAFFSPCSNGYCPSESFNAIASAASTPLTVEAN